jgi:hypothetical protein
MLVRWVSIQAKQDLGVLEDQKFDGSRRDKFPNSAALRTNIVLLTLGIAFDEYIANVRDRCPRKRTPFRALVAAGLHWGCISREKNICTTGGHQREREMNQDIDNLV